MQPLMELHIPFLLQVVSILARRILISRWRE
jgi:hypothetical protein